MQRFFKGRTNNHLTWVMVDATDFATPESALSAATKIKIYGKLRGGTGTNFVSSGAGSLTNDITHVGASALGIYTIALVKADLSDASAAWYDQYIISLSATGAAYQTLVVEGAIDESTMSALISDIQSAVLLAQSAASDAASAAAQANSRVLLVQSRLSDLDSRLVSDVSDIRSALSDAHSDLKSAIGAITVTISASDVSDIASAVVAGLPIASTVSDIYSMLSDLMSDFQSRVPKRVATDSQLSDMASDIKSAVTVAQSMASDAASAAQQANSRLLVNQSTVSDIYSLLSDVQSDFQSRVPKAVATNSQLSDLASDLRSVAIVAQSSLSDIYSLITAGVNVSSDAVSDVVVGMLAGVIEGTTTLAQSLRLANAANAGKLAGAATTTVTIRDLADSKDRITATVDSNGNRTATTLDVS